jgi:putative hydrolases of HD superfamily
MTSSSQQIRTFSHLASQLKLIERFKGQKFWRDYPAQDRWESVADHSWRLSLLVVLFAGKLAQPFDLTWALKMALIHDLPEIIAGDASPLGESGTGTDSHAYNSTIWNTRHKDEKAAAKAIFSKLGPAEAQGLCELWLEIETTSSFEAKVVKALDKIDAMTQVLEMQQGHMFPEHLEFTIKYGSKGSDIDPAISEYASHIAKELRTQYHEFKS